MNDFDTKPRDHSPLDDELAAMTDSLIDKRGFQPASEQARDLEPILRSLHGLMVEEKVSDAFASRLNLRMEQEWTQRQRSRRSPQRTFLSPTARLVSLAAALVLVFVTILLWAPSPASENLSGTVVGDSSGLIGAAMLIGAGVLVFVGIFIFRGRK